MLQSDIDTYMNELVVYAEKTNPIWPFASFIINENGYIITKATDCAHISPLYHAESLAVHTLIQAARFKHHGALTLITNVEPDVLSISAIHWANVVHDLSIETIIYGTPLTEIQKLWPFCIDISAQEIIHRSMNSKIRLIGPEAPDLCLSLFKRAKMAQNKIDGKHPARKKLSTKVEDYFNVSLPA